MLQLHSIFILITSAPKHAEKGKGFEMTMMMMMGGHAQTKRGEVSVKWNSRVFLKHLYIYEYDDPDSENVLRGKWTTERQK